MQTAERFTQIEKALQAADTEIAVLTRRKQELETSLTSLYAEAGVKTKEELVAKIATWDTKIETALKKIETEAKGLGLLGEQV